PLSAAIGGAQRMAPPVFSASLTSICAFLPLLVISGIIGSIISAIPMVVVCVLIASLIECFLILPGHMRLALAADGEGDGRFARFRRGFDRRFEAFREGPFRRSVAWSIDNRYAIVAGALAVLMLAIGLVAGGRIGFRFFPTPESDTAYANIEMAAGTPRRETLAMLGELDRALRATVIAVEGEGSDLVEMALVTVGSEVGEDGPRTDRSTDTSGGVQLQLRTADARDIRMDDFLARWRDEVQPRAGLETLTIRSPAGGPPGRDVDIRLTGGTPETLKAAAEQVKALLRSYPGVKEISDTLPFGKPETILELTPRGRALGFELRDVSAQLRGALEGEIAERFPRGEEEVTVRVRNPADDLDAAAIERLFLRAPGGAETPLSEVVAQSERAGFSQIQREAGLREVAIQADVDPAVTTTQETTARLEADGLAAIAQQYGLGYRFRGKSEEMAETFADMQLGAVLGLAGIYIILAWVFGSYTRPVAVLAVIPLGFIGAIFGHLLMGYDLTILSIIGVIGLSGIVVNDSIVLVTTIDERMKRQSALDAVIDGACDRLRAVLLTSLTTIGGLTPLLFETSLQAQFLIPMALTFVFGLMGATLLILYVAPAIALIQHDIGDGLRGLRRKRPISSPQAAE
ncbi:MAG: efflux RND transporter permease subunit, partial [Pseudomonadota bacterium]